MRQLEYLYTVVALGTSAGVETISKQSFAASQEVVAALEESLRGRYELSIHDAGVVTLPLTEEELRTFRDSGDDQSGLGGFAAKDLYVDKLREAIQEVGAGKVALYDGVVATVVLDMPETELRLTGDGGTGGIYLPSTFFEPDVSTGVGVMTENITNTEVATRQESTRVLAHEIGHSFRLGHAGTAQCHDETAAPWDGSLPVRMTDRGCTPEEYGDGTNIMGQAPVPSQAKEGELLNALQLRQLRALPDAEFVDITPEVATAGTTLEYTLHTVSSADEGVRLIALPVIPGAQTPISDQDWDEVGSRPYLVLSPEYDAPFDARVPRRFTNHSLKVIYALANTQLRENTTVSSRAIPLSTTDENFNAPKDIGAPPGYTGPVFVDHAGNTVSIVSHQPTSVTVRIELNQAQLRQ